MLDTPGAPLTTHAAKDSDSMADHESSKSPAFQFYPKDFLSDINVVCMSMQERGCYITLICVCWTEGTLPSNPERLARLCGMSPAQFGRVWPALEVCFKPQPRHAEYLIHPRLEKEREKQEEFRRRQGDNGRKGGRPRKPTPNPPETQTKGLGYSGFQTNNPTETQPKPKKSSSSAICDLQSSSADSSQRERTRTTDELSVRAGEFCQWYEDTHVRLLGVGYIGTRHDYDDALRIVAKITNDKDLRDAAIFWFGMDDDFATRGTRTIGKFASRASDCLLRARRVTA